MKKNQILGPIAPGTELKWFSSKNRKTNKPRRVIRLPMSAMVCREIEALSQWWDPANDLMFPNPRTGKPYSSLKGPLTTACRKLGVPEFRPNVDLRHLAATEYLTDLKDLHAVARISGHRNTVVLDERYAHLAHRADPAVVAFDRKLEGAFRALG